MRPTVEDAPPLKGRYKSMEIKNLIIFNFMIDSLELTYPISLSSFEFCFFKICCICQKMITKNLEEYATKKTILHIPFYRSQYSCTHHVF